MSSQSYMPCISNLGRWSVAIPWNRADDIQTRLRKRGCPTTVCLNPEDRMAWLEPWPEVDPSQLLAELKSLRI
jgi:hypothetical protein